MTAFLRTTDGRYVRADLVAIVIPDKLDLAGACAVVLTDGGLMPVDQPAEAVVEWLTVALKPVTGP